MTKFSIAQREIYEALPPSNTRRWVIRRKAQVVLAIKQGKLLFTEACERYKLSTDELKSWMALYDSYGAKGLRATRMQEYLPAKSRSLMA